MSKAYSNTDPAICAYVEQLYPEDTILRDIRVRAAQADLPDIHVSSTDGQHLETLTRLIGAKKVVEIGTLAGYSGVRIARSLPDNGKLYTFEFSERHADLAKKSFEQAGVENKVQIYIGPAIERLASVEHFAPFDLVFIDADKEGYQAYLDWAAVHLRVGGAAILDNTFAYGGICDDRFKDTRSEADVIALRTLNQRLAQDARFISTILPTGEGLTIAVKRG